jgi:uncharacterized membrane protein YphA (DoxX/SURF4 family)
MGLQPPKGFPRDPPFEIARHHADRQSSPVQRLFSMFPTGTAGAALFVLRISVAVTLLVDGTAHWALVTSFWIFLGFAIPALFLCLGLLTPYGSICCCLLRLVVLFHTRGQGDFHLGISIVNGLILAFLGSGAHSVDARLFGRRLLTVPPRKSFR